MTAARSATPARRLRLWPWLVVVTLVFGAFLVAATLLEQRREHAKAAAAEAAALQGELTTFIQVAVGSAPPDAEGDPPPSLLPVLRQTVRKSRGRIDRIRRLGVDDARLTTLDELMVRTQRTGADLGTTRMTTATALRLSAFVTTLLRGVSDDQRRRVDRIANQTRTATAALVLAVLLVVAGVIWRARRAVAAEADRHARTLLDLAYNDGLTGLPNRRSFEDDAARAPGEVLVFLCDLDGFKGLNDREGHEAGDAALVAAADALTAAVGARGRVYRLGGDEFCGIVDAGFPDLVDTLEAAVDAAIGDRGVTISAGAAHVPLDGDTPRAALRRADERMYDVKGQRAASSRSSSSTSRSIVASA